MNGSIKEVSPEIKARTANSLLLVFLAPLIFQLVLTGYFLLFPSSFQSIATSHSKGVSVSPDLAVEVAGFVVNQAKAFLPTGTQPTHAERSFEDTSCVIGIADLHGDIETAHTVLKLSGVSNATHLWAAGSCILVQTGDLVDRGPHSVALTKLFEDIKVEATAAGGQVITLLGNHELMNLEGEFRYLAKDELKALGEEELKQRSLEEILEDVPVKYRNSVSKFEDATARAGAAKWATLMGPGGWLGDAIRKKKAAALVGTGACATLFVHAGLFSNVLEAVESSKFESFGLSPIDRVNGVLTYALQSCDGTGSCPSQDEDTSQLIKFILGGSGLFWTRDYARKREEEVRVEPKCRAWST